ncbi:MAG: SDR family NAD(P)-dependent oxidoreductase [Pseudomonadota bacterium]
MTKTILITGSTDGIGLLTAKRLAEAGHKVLLHGRNRQKLDTALAGVGAGAEGFVADLSAMSEVAGLVAAVSKAHGRLDILINNAGVLKAPRAETAEGFDIRFMVNTFAPVALTRGLLPIIPRDGRIINVSSAAQAPVDPAAMAGAASLGDMAAYSQSKLAITIWTQEMAKTLGQGPAVIAVNPGSLLASKMVKEGFGIAGNDLGIGAGILCDAALGDRFAGASGQYFDNDSGHFAAPHAAAKDPNHVRDVMQGIEDALATLNQTSN